MRCTSFSKHQAIDSHKKGSALLEICLSQPWNVYLTVEAISLTLPGLGSTWYRWREHTFICMSAVTIVKEHSIRTHHIEKHPTFWTNFPVGLQERDAKVVASYIWSHITLVRSGCIF